MLRPLVGKIRALRDAQRDVPVDDSAFIPRFWQQQVLDGLQEEAGDRRINWIYDPAGNNGKSRLASYLVSERGAVCLAGKMNDMTYIYDRQPIVIFDIGRSAVEHTDHLYGMAEALKNGCIVSGKYMGAMKRFKPPHVIFMSNERPKEGKWTADRLRLYDLSNPMNGV